jgi:hypothetical protein
MIADTNGVDCLLIRENEIGIYDTVQYCVIYSCTIGNTVSIRTKDGQEMKFVFPKEKFIERITKCQKK